MSNLGQREPQPAGLTHERQQPQHVRVVVSVAGRRAPWRLEDPACFVQPERLAAEAAACRDLPDEQSVARHEREHSPYPKGQGQGGTIRGRAAVYFQHLGGRLDSGAVGCVSAAAELFSYVFSF